MHKIKPGKAAGPDSIKAKKINMAGDSLAEALYGLSRGIICKKWLRSNRKYAKLKNSAQKRKFKDAQKLQAPLDAQQCKQDI